MMIPILVQLNERLILKTSSVGKSQRTLSKLREERFANTQLRLQQQLENRNVESLKLKLSVHYDHHLWFLHGASAGALKHAWMNCLLKKEHILSDVSKPMTVRYDDMQLFVFHRWGLFIQKDADKRGGIREKMGSSYVHFRLRYDTSGGVHNLTTNGLVPSDLSTRNICQRHTVTWIDSAQAPPCTCNSRHVCVSRSSSYEVAFALHSSKEKLRS